MAGITWDEKIFSHRFTFWLRGSFSKDRNYGRSMYRCREILWWLNQGKRTVHVERNFFKMEYKVRDSLFVR